LLSRIHCVERQTHTTEAIHHCGMELGTVLIGRGLWKEGEVREVDLSACMWDVCKICNVEKEYSFKTKTTLNVNKYNERAANTKNETIML
jgi:hypothetical protein